MLVKVLLLGAILLGSNAALAKDKKVTPPDETGAYAIGHKTVILTDTSRNIDGSTPPEDDGRFLYLDIWYPTDVKTDAHIIVRLE